MDITQMRYFLAVAETLHFRLAAERLHLSQPSLSQQIQQIEKEIGVLLFDRSNRKVELTAAGAALVPRVRAIIGELADTIQAVRRIDQGEAGKLTVTLVSTALVGILPLAMMDLQRSVPGIDLQLKECEPKEQLMHLINGTADIGFMHANFQDAQLSSAVIQRDHLIAALPAALAPTGSVRLSGYVDCTAIMPSPFTSAGFYSHVQRAFQMAGVTPKKTIYTNLIIGGINLVAAGLGIALVPSSFQSVQISGVVYRELDVTPEPVELLAVWKADSRSRLLARFLSSLKDCGQSSAL